MTIRQRVSVGPGGSIQFRAPELPEGTVAEVVVVVDAATLDDPGANRPTPEGSFESMMGSAKGMFASPADVDDYIREERESWER